MPATENGQQDDLDGIPHAVAIDRHASTNKSTAAAHTERKLHAFSRTSEEARIRFGNGKMYFSDALQIYRDRLEANPEIKPNTKCYYRDVIEFIEKSWPGVQDRDIGKISERDCQDWLEGYREQYAASVVNNSIGVLRKVFQVAVDVGAVFKNPANSLKRVKIRPKQP